MKSTTISTKFKLRRIVLLSILFLMCHGVASAAIMIGYIPVQGVDITSTGWQTWIKEKAGSVYFGEIQYHEVESVESLYELMSTFSMVDFAVLDESQLKKFRSLSDVVGPVSIGDDAKLFALPGIEARILDYLGKNICGGTKEPAPEKTPRRSSPQTRRDNVNFVAGLYREILQREPDRSGLSYWGDRLNSGVLTREQVEGHIRASSEAMGIR